MNRPESFVLRAEGLTKTCRGANALQMSRIVWLPDRNGVDKGTIIKPLPRHTCPTC